MATIAGDAANFVPQKLFPWLVIQPSFSQSTLSSGLTWVSGFHISQDLEEVRREKGDNTFIGRGVKIQYGV